jgi:hypothetical protein
MDEDSPLGGGTDTAAAAPAPVPPGGPSRAERREAAQQERVERMAEQREQQRLEELRAQAEAEAAAQVQAQPMPGQQRLETLMQGLKMTPVQDENGELQDIIVEPNADMADNPFAQTPPGTRCHTINNIPMNRMHEAIATLSDDQPACLQCTLPDGSAHTLCY